METTLERSGKHGVKLTVEVPADEVARDLDRAYRKVGQQVRVPGFRKGHVPRKIIDAQIGREAVLDEFVQESLPTYYRQAVREHELAPISDPDINVEQVEEGKPLIFTATMEVRPRLELEDYKSVTVPMPETDVTERDIDEFVDRLRERFAELESVSHPARRGDYVVMDLRGTIHGVEIDELSAKDQLYEVGSGGIVPELDTELEDKRKGEILKFNATPPEQFGNRAGQEVTFQVLLKEVKAKRLPVVDDEFAKMASEFDTLAELREDLRTKLADVKRREARAELRDRVLQELVSRVDVDLPDSLVDHETEHRVERATEQAERAGRTLEDLLQEQDWDELRFRSDARAHAIRAIKADLVLEAVARQEGIQVSAEELQAAIADLAQALGRDVKDVARTLERSGQVTSLAGDIIRSKALDVLVEAAEGVSEEGSLKREDASAEGSSEAPARDQGADE
jgi:trigger factor